MISNKNNQTQTDNDLKFTPLSIQDSLKLNNFVPPSVNGSPMNSGTTFLCFPALTINYPGQQIGNFPAVNATPLTPYPSNIPEIESTEMTPTTKDNLINNLPNINDQLEYPTEVNSDDLFSYNKPRIDPNYTNNSVNHLDILRSFALDDFISSDSFRGDSTQKDIDSIFKKIVENNSVVLATMKAYRIPYPIAKLLIKNIIKLTLEYKGR